MKPPTKRSAKWYTHKYKHIFHSFAVKIDAVAYGVEHWLHWRIDTDDEDEDDDDDDDDSGVDDVDVDETASLCI